MLKRIGISLDGDLLDKFDELISSRGWENRSEAVRDLIREQLVEEEWSRDETETMAVVAFVYDHHAHDLSQKLAEIQHDSYASVVSTLHVHMDHHNCLEILALRGRPGELRRLGSALIGVRGVKHGRFMPTTSGADLT